MTNAFGTPISNPESFHLEARYQRVCAVCGKGGRFHAHHVVDKQWLRVNRLPLYDTRNALRLCDHGKRCHMNFEEGGVAKVQVLVRHLKDQNLCYLWQVMGHGGTVWLDRYYGGDGGDDRWWRHTRGECELCQR